MSVGNGKGLVTYFKASMFKNQQDFITPNMQATKFCSENLDVINVYRSSKGNSLDLLNTLVEMVTPGVSTLITGDFNICFFRNPQNRMSKGIVKAGFQQLISEPTHILGGHIYHVYWMSRNLPWKDPILQRHSPYYSRCNMRHNEWKGKVTKFNLYVDINSMISFLGKRWGRRN